jgi:flagella basal body P-ring formation protein FlgA
MLAFATPVWAAEPEVALPAQLRPAVMIEGDVIHLGDIWENLGTKGDTALANAPQPGKRIVLETRWLAAVAHAYGIDWRPASTFERTVVERAGRTLDVRAVERELREALVLEGAPQGAGIEIANRTALSLPLPITTDPTVGIRDLVYDARMNRFTATIEVPAGAPGATRLKVSGSIYSSIRLPVLARPLGRGDVISERDIEWIEVRDQLAQRDVITNPRHLIGLEPRQALRAGAPVRTADLQKPVSVAKNSAVTMVVRTAFMTLTAQGRAVENGSLGDVIRVTNLQSKQVVDARVDGPGQVSVIPAGQRALLD